MEPSADRLREFVEIVNRGSISEAARYLGIPRATLSRRLRDLEDSLGVRLLHRETRRLTLTHQGTILIERARRLVEEIENAWVSVRRTNHEPYGRLRLSLPPTTLFQELLLSFAVRFPEVDLEVVATPQHLDLVAEGVDVALRFGVVREQGLIARKVLESRVSPVASAGYIKKNGLPHRLEALQEHHCLVQFAEGWRPQQNWPLRQGGTVAIRGRFVCNEVPLRLAATLRGLGISLLPDFLTEPYRRSGQLVWLLDEQVGGTARAFVVYPEREFLLPQVRAFLEHTVAYYADGMAFNEKMLPAVFPDSSET